MKDKMYLVALVALSLLTVACKNGAPKHEPAPPPHPHFEAEYPDVHDPVMALGEDGRYYVFSTGEGVGVMSSADLKTWQHEPSVFAREAIPQWAKDSVPGYEGHTWAPDISRHGDYWYLYYSCSTFGKNGSAIGLAVNRTLDPKSPLFRWEDRGAVVVSHSGRDPYNAIDPNLVMSDGKPYLVFGSFWDGLQLVPLAADLQTLTEAPHTIARRYDPAQTEGRLVAPDDAPDAGDNAIEAPFIFFHNGWYYLMASHDYCCRGANSTYKTVYGRSHSLDEPFVDQEGRDMAQGGGTLLVGPDEHFYGVGHTSAYALADGRWVFLAHGYDASVGARAKLYLRALTFDNDGWLSLSVM